MNDLILYTIENAKSELAQCAVVKDSLTTQTRLGYVAATEECPVVKTRAMVSCEASCHAAYDHFRGVTKMVRQGNNRSAAS